MDEDEDFDDFGIGEFHDEYKDMELDIDDINIPMQFREATNEDHSFSANDNDFDNFSGEEYGIESAMDDQFEEYNENEDFSLNPEELSEQVREDEALADSIMTSIETVLPTQRPSGPIRMTDLGYKISQMVLMKQKDNVNAVDFPDEPESKDVLLERHLSGRRRHKTVSMLIFVFPLISNCY